MNKTVVLAFSYLLVLPALALAAPEDWGPQPGNWELTIQGTGTSDDSFDNHNAGAEGALGFYLTPGFELGLRQGVSFVDRPTDDSWNGSSRGFVDYNFNLGRLRPFIGVSAGYLYGEDTDERWIAGPEAGLKFYVQRKAFLFAMGEYNFTFEDSDQIDDVYDDGRFVYSLGLGINW